jgi:hypothetical protein
VNNAKDIYLNTIAEYLEYTLHQERGMYEHGKVTFLVDIRPGRVSIVGFDSCFQFLTRNTHRICSTFLFENRAGRIPK